MRSTDSGGVGGGEAGVSGVYLSVSVWLAGGTVSVCATVATSQGGWAPHRWAGVSAGNGRSSKACWAVSLASQPVRGAPPSAIVRRSGSTYRASILEYIIRVGYYTCIPGRGAYLTINSVFIYHTKSHPCLPSRISRPPLAYL